MVKDIYDMLLDKATGDATDEQYDSFVNEHRFNDISSVSNPSEDLRFSDLD